MIGDVLELEAAFERVVAEVLADRRADEHLTMSLVGEHSQFIRFNRAKVRQTGWVRDAHLTLTLMTCDRLSFRELPLTGLLEVDVEQVTSALADLRGEVPQLPADPYLVLPQGTATSHEIHAGTLLSADQAVDAILSDVAMLDFTGIYAGGTQLRAYADSAGQKHWFATDSFALDYSIFIDSGQAVKGTFASNHWDQREYAAKLEISKTLLARLAQSPKAIPKGQYRTYLAPAAVAEIVTALSWGGLSEAALQQGKCPLRLLHLGEKELSPQFTLTEDFRRGLVPRFNDLGEIAPLTLPLIKAGKVVNTLISSRTAKEYGKTANGAHSDEGMRSPDLAPGTLPPTQILTTLERGLYLSNLHYLNWSDRPMARLTGMTRYACFWVEQGEIVAPIENLRFDESLYRCLGDNLCALTTTQEFIPDVETYDHRHLGGIWVPGMVVEDFTYTL